MELRPYQREAINAIENEWHEGLRKKLLLVLPTGCHDLSQQLLMADGTTKYVTNINVGDYLIGDNGVPVKVLYKHTGQKQMYKIIPRKGNAFIETDDHILSLIKTNEKKVQIS